ncbi:MAG: Helix-turn-helix of insertion element transposase [Planctomycetota bacterium]|nr:Helix-turn-helix of insertion element transposase [Planctomycetota bacterium]
MSDPERPPFAWTATTEAAALDLAADNLTDRQISAKLDIARSTLSVWKLHPEFAARVDEFRAEIRESIRKKGIAVKENRVRALNTRWKALHRVIEARAAEMEEIPGGDTGLLCHTVRGIGRGEDFERIDVYEVDTGLLRELRETEKQAAQELGQWAEKHEHTGPDGGALILTFKAAIEKVYGERPAEPAEAGEPES